MKEDREELTQRVSHLLSRAMTESGMTAGKLSKMRGDEKRTALTEESIRLVAKGKRLPRLDSISDMLLLCGFELTLGMRKIEENDDE